MKQLIKRLIPEKYHDKIRAQIFHYFRKKYRASYAQAGEDMILNHIFSGASKGTYIDVGANNPTVQSNTYFFYTRGWEGINIDALPGSMRAFKQMRKRDKNLVFAISDKEEFLQYHMFNPSFYNSFDPEAPITYKSMFVKTIELQTKNLSWILDNHLGHRSIDFLTVDVEGLDLSVLKSNNWNKYRPKVIIIESFLGKSGRNENSPEEIFLNEQGYSFFCATPTNSFYIENNFLEQRFPDRY